MGYWNAPQIRLLEHLRRCVTEDDLDFIEAERCVEASQANCHHPAADVRGDTRPIDKDSKTGKYKKGDLPTWCRRCSKILAVIRDGKEIKP